MNFVSFRYGLLNAFRDLKQRENLFTIYIFRHYAFVLNIKMSFYAPDIKKMFSYRSSIL